MRLRLKAISQDVDFRSTELAIFEKYRRSKDFAGDPRTGEAYLFVSKSGTQLLWVLHYEAKVQVLNRDRRRIESLKMRVSGGYWNPLMLQNYANDLGIELEGIKRFEEVFYQTHKRKIRVAA